MKNILFASATQLIENIKNKTYSIEEVIRIYLTQIEQHNPSINAITDMYDKDMILKEAKHKDLLLQQGQDLGLLYGLPMTIKDSYQVKGLITSNGIPYLKNNRVAKDAFLVKRLRGAGAIILGKTNLPLFAIDWQSTNKWFGQTNNPYDLSRVVGGSSGGSCASLAAGFSALEMGSDAGGSIRVPAHFCGVCGLRPTENSLASRGHLESPGQVRSIRYITSCGPLARNVEDLILAMKVLWDKKASHSEIAPVDFYRSSWDEQQPLKIAYSNTLGDIEIDDQYKIVYDQFINKLKQSTHLIKEEKPSYNSNACIDLWGSIVGFDFGANMPSLIPFKKLLTYLFIYSKYKDKQWAKGLVKGVNISSKNYAKALEKKDDISDEFNCFFDNWDVWITPVAATPAFKHQKAGKPFVINGKKLPYTKAFTPYNFATAIMGHPVATIPIGQTTDGLPVGIQIHGRRWDDLRLLQISQILETFTARYQVPKMFED